MPARPSSTFALEIDGFDVGTLKKFSGLGAQADIVTSPAGSGGRVEKHVSNFRWTPGRATVGIGMGKGLYGWLKATLDQGGAAKGGAFRTADGNAKLKSSLAFSNALVTEFTVPRLDAASKDAAFFDVGFEAEEVVWTAGQGQTLDPRPSAGPAPKAWLSSNFRIEIGGLPCQRVAAIESLSWKFTPATSSGGVVLRRPGTLAAGSVTVPDLVLSISGVDYAAWADAARKWFVDGRRLDGDEMRGRLVFLGPNLVDELGAIDFSPVGFRSFAHPEAVTNSEQVERFTVTLYVEKMQLSIKNLEA